MRSMIWTMPPPPPPFAGSSGCSGIAANIDLMGLAGFCRNCLGDWVAEAGGMDKEAGRTIVHGMPTAEWKARYHVAASDEQLKRMEESMAKNPRPR